MDGFPWNHPWQPWPAPTSPPSTTAPLPSLPSSKPNKASALVNTGGISGICHLWGYPIAGWFINVYFMENPSRNGWFGLYPHFRKPPLTLQQTKQCAMENGWACFNLVRWLAYLNMAMWCDFHSYVSLPESSSPIKKFMGNFSDIRSPGKVKFTTFFGCWPGLYRFAGKIWGFLVRSPENMIKLTFSGGVIIAMAGKPRSVWFEGFYSAGTWSKTFFFF